MPARPTRSSSARWTSCASGPPAGSATCGSRASTRRACTCRAATTALAAPAPSSCCWTIRRCTGCHPTRSPPPGTCPACGARRRWPPAPWPRGSWPRSWEAGDEHGTPRRGATPAASRRRRRAALLLRQADREGAAVERQHPLVPVQRRARRRVRHARAGRPAGRQPAAGGQRHERLGVGRGREPGAAGPRPRPAVAVPPHAAGGQADLADEHRELDPGRARARRGRRGGGGAAGDLPAAAQGRRGGRRRARPAAGDLHRRADRRHLGADLARRRAGAAASAGGLAVIVTPPAEAGPARRLALGGAVVEVATSEVMRRRLGPLAQPYRQGRAKRLSSLATATAGAGVLLLGLGGRRRATAAAGGGLLLLSSAFQRFAVYRAGVASADDPSYTVSRQRERIASSGQEPAIRR